MIHFQLGEQTKSGTEVVLPIAVTLNAAGASAPETNITFTFTLTDSISQVKVTYSYTDPNLLRVVEGGQTFEVQGE